MLLPDAQLWLTGYCFSACQHNAYSFTREKKNKKPNKQNKDVNSGGQENNKF